jgi:hypothetical protein
VRGVRGLRYAAEDVARTCRPPGSSPAGSSGRCR